MKMWKIVLTLTVTRLAHGCLENIAIMKHSTVLSEAVTDVIVNFYMNDSLTINFLRESESEESGEEIDDIISEILYKVPNRVIVQFEEYKKIMNPRKKFYNIIFCDSFVSFEKIFAEMDSKHFNLQGFYLIVLTEGTEKVYEDMAQIFETLWTKFVTNANILWRPADSDEDALMYTYYPFTSIYCEKAYPVMLNQYSNGQWFRDVEYFPNKMKNLHRCPIRVATFATIPFMIIRDDGNQVEVDGIDGILLRVLSQKINFNFELSFSKEQWGNIYENGTKTGSVRMVVEKEVNMSLGFFSSTALRDSYMTPSYVYYTTKLVWMIPPGRIISSFEKLLRPFQTSLWICILSIYLVAFLIVGIIMLKSKSIQTFVIGENIYDPKLNIVRIVLGGSLTQMPRTNFARSVFIIFVIFCFIIQNSYTGGLFYFMRRTVREPKVASTNEMIERNFKFYMYQASKPFIENLEKVVARAEIVGVNNFAQIFNKMSDPAFKGSFLTSEDHLAYRNILNFPKHFFHHALESICTNNLVIYFTKESCLVSEVDHKIMYLVSSGIIEKWSSGFIDKNFLNQRSVHQSKALSIDHVFGAFQILLVGLFTSFMAFAFEFLSRYRLWHYLISKL